MTVCTVRASSEAAAMSAIRPAFGDGQMQDPAFRVQLRQSATKRHLHTSLSAEQPVISGHGYNAYP